MQKKTYHNVFLAIFFYSGSQPILVRFWLAAATYFKGLEVFMINIFREVRIMQILYVKIEGSSRSG